MVLYFPHVLYFNREPGVNDDITQGVIVGQPWAYLNEDRYFINVNNAEGAAKWIEVPDLGLLKLFFEFDVNFSATPAMGTTNVTTISFTNLTTGPGMLFNPYGLNTYLWDFGDGNTSTAENPNHIYDIADTYDVSLTVSNPLLSYTETKINYILIVDIPAPVVNFSWLPLHPEVGDTITFTNSSTGDIDEYLWDFGDGNTSIAENPTHSYSTEGVYNISLTATGSGGQSIIYANQIIDGGLMVGSLVANFQSGESLGGEEITTFNEGDTVQFEDLSYGTATQYVWDFGDVPNLPQPDFVADPTVINDGVTVSFTNNTINSASSYLWNFGDGNTSSNENPSHQYTAGGIYTVYLIAFTTSGSSAVEIKNNYITVNSDPDISSTNDQVFEVNVTDWLAGTWSLPSGWLAEKVSSGQSLQITHNMSLDPDRFNGLIVPIPGIFIDFDNGVQNMVINDSNTVTFTQIGLSDEFKIRLIFSNRAGNPDLLTQYRIRVLDWATGTFDGPDGWNITKVSGTWLKIEHNKAAEIKDWESPDFEQTNLQNIYVENNNNLYLQSADTISNTYTLYLYFVD